MTGSRSCDDLKHLKARFRLEWSQEILAGSLVHVTTVCDLSANLESPSMGYTSYEMPLERSPLAGCVGVSRRDHESLYPRIMHGVRHKSMGISVGSQGFVWILES